MSLDSQLDLLTQWAQSMQEKMCKIVSDERRLKCITSRPKRNSEDKILVFGKNGQEKREEKKSKITLPCSLTIL